MTHKRFWWNCKHIEVDNNLGVAFCTKNNDFCNKSKCTEIQGNPKKQYYRERMEELQNENEQLKKELAKFKEWEKHIGDVKREDLDKVFNMSIYEIAEGFEYYKKRIKELENGMKE